mgnify:CR=1 FL=1
MTNTREFLEAVKNYKLKLADYKKLNKKIEKLRKKRNEIDLKVEELEVELYTKKDINHAFDALISAITDWNGKYE